MIDRRGELQKGTSFVQKPFTPVSLASAVRRLLDGKPDRV